MNNYANAKAQRQSAILEIAASEDVSTQDDLVKALKKRGISATQVSVSRDVAELGLVKVGGMYKPATAASAQAAGAADPELPLRTFVRHVEAAGPNMVVIRCDAGTAQRVGLVIDGMSPEGVVGTIAGDDTVFIAVSSAAANKKIVQFLEARMSKQ